MANYKAITTGNWSNLAIWQDDSSGSYSPSLILPSSGDTVYSNNFSVTIDIDFVVFKITNKSSTNVTAGGGFIISTSRTITCLDSSWGIEGSNTSNATVVTIQTSSVVNITSNIIAGTTTNTYGVYSNVQTTLNVIGNVSGGSFITNTSGSHGIFMDTSSVSSVVTITGNVYAKGTTNTYQVTNVGVFIRSASTTLNITGNLYGSNVISQGPYTDIQFAVYMFGANSVLNVTGDVFALLNAAIYSLAGTVSVVGNIYSSSTSFAIISQIITISGTINNLNGYSAIQSNRIIFNQLSPTQWTFQTEIGGTNKTLYPAGTDIGNPLPSNVRSGTVFGPNSEFTGTCAIPSATTVSLGVPVDNTIGTAVNNMSTIFNIQESQVTGKTIGTKILQIAPRKIGVSLIQNVGGVVLTNPQGLLLDLYPATSAYSLRRLSLNYINPLIRVRRGGDNSELEIGYDSNNELDITTLLSFVNNGDGNGFIVRWFDQTNNNNNVSQNTVLGQPQIVTSGSMILVNNKPSIRFNGTSQYLDGGNVILNPNNKNLLSFVVAKTPTTGVNYFYTRALPGGTPNRYALSNGTQFYGLVSDGNNVGRDAFTSNVTSNQSLYSQKIEVSVGHDIWRNNVQYGSNIFPNSFGNTTYNFLIGAYNNGSGTVPPSAFGAGEHQEYVIYQQASLPDRATISSIINSYYNIY